MLWYVLFTQVCVSHVLVRVGEVRWWFPGCSVPSLPLYFGTTCCDNCGGAGVLTSTAFKLVVGRVYAARTFLLSHHCSSISHAMAVDYCFKVGGGIWSPSPASLLPVLRRCHLSSEPLLHRLVTALFSMAKTW